MEPLNFSYLNSLSGGDKEFELKILNVIKEEFPFERSEYEQNVEKGNFKLASENVHKIKHKISILGLNKSKELAVEHEELLKVNDLTLKDDFEKVLDIITDFINQL